MAKALYGIPINEVHGSVAGTTFQTTQYGACIQRKVNQKFRRSPGQSAARQGLSFAARSWNDLTQAQRDSWLSASVLGVAGFNLFQQVNSRRPRLGLSLVNTFADPGYFFSSVPNSASIVFNQTFQVYVVNVLREVTGSPGVHAHNIIYRIALSPSAGAKPNPSETSSRWAYSANTSPGFIGLQVASSLSLIDISPTGDWFPGTEMILFFQAIDQATGIAVSPELQYSFIIPPKT